MIPTYQRSNYILATIRSVEAQGPYEIIVIDDGSLDDTAERLAPLAQANRIRYVRQSNAGMAAARNAGAALAAGAYLYFLDDDDLSIPGALGALLDELERHPEAPLAYGEIVVFSGSAPAIPELQPSARDVSHATFLRFNPIGSPGQVLVRRTAFESIGGFRREFPYTEDWDLWLRLVERSPARWTNTPVLAYRMHERNGSRDVVRMNDSSMRVARQHLRRLPSADRPRMRYFTYRALREYHIPRLRALLRERARNGDWRAAIAASRACLAAYAVDALATVQLKMYLASHGRWRLREEEIAV